MEGHRLTIRLNSSDNVVVAAIDLLPGTEIAQEGIACQDLIPFGHKVATARIECGSPIRKYGEIIGFASRTIEPGEHVHTQNVAMADFSRDWVIGVEARSTDLLGSEIHETFSGIVREDGRVATRNYIGILSTVNCSASVARTIADAFGPEELAEFPNVDGVVAICHGWGCGMAENAEGSERLRRTLAGWARNPNFAAILWVGLGCEANSIEALLRTSGLKIGPLCQAIKIQETGGTTQTVREGVIQVRKMLGKANEAERRPVPASHLILGLECGGSDAYSGITANPALGVAVDRLVQHGGAAVLSETPEIYGAEHLLVRRAVSREIGEKFLALFQWWDSYTRSHGVTMDNNPTPGNRAAGLTSILEKSLGAVAKGGSTNLVDVYGYAEFITARGLVFMDTPGYDPVSVTGMVAGGANLICFTTGCGSVFGCKPVPVVKLASNTALYQRMNDDMDLNCGTIVDEDVTVEEMGERIFRFVLETASGRRTQSERHGMGDHEFVPWQMGAVL